ncbi:SSD domain-containing protein [Aphelenchoides bicaudatus]|nr:SSD domain-containing protein [Aphelenchoides bicaudatus]
MIAIGLIRELGRLGVLVGRYPAVSILLGLLISAPGLAGFLKFRLDLEMNGGFVSSNAASHREIADQQSFFGARGLPWYMALFGKSNGNLLDDKAYNEINSFYETSMNMNLTYDESDYYQFKELCSPLCGINAQLQELMKFSWFADFRYPVSKAMGFDVNIGKHVFERNITNGKLAGAKMLAFYYTSLITDDVSRLRLENFERRINEMAQEHNQNASKLVHLTIHGTNTAGAEIQRGFKDIMKLTIGSVSVASLLFFIFLLLSSWMREKLSCQRFFFCLVSLILPLLAVASGCGIVCIFAPLNMLYIMAPIGTLVFVSHIQNVLHLVSKFDGLEVEAKRNQYIRRERIGATFEQITPTNSIINLGLIFGFGAARFFLPSSYADFSLGVAFSLLYLWLLELLILGGLLAFECNGSTAPTKYYEKSKSQKRSNFLYTCSLNFSKFLFRPYSFIICSIPGRIVGIILLLAFCGFPCHWGIRKVHSQMDFRRFLPTDSVANQGFDFMDTIWRDFHQIVFIVNKPPNFADYGEYMEFRKFIYDIQAIPNVLNSSSHMSWIFDYYNAELNMDFFSEKAALQAPNMTKFHNFITTFPYEAWADGIKFEYLDRNKTVPKINRMVVMSAFNDISGLEGKAKLINLCRAVALKNPQLNISSFDTDSRTADIIENVMPTFLKWSLILLITTSIMPLITLWNLAAAFLSLVGCGFFLASAYAMIGLAGLPLDLLGMTMLVTISTVGIRISLHFIGEFLLVWAHDDRTLCALQNSISITLKTMVLCLVVVTPLLFLGTVPLFVQFALMTSIVLATSLIVSTFVLPLIADFLPIRMISLESCC